MSKKPTSQELEQGKEDLQFIRDFWNSGDPVKKKCVSQAIDKKASKYGLTREETLQIILEENL